jgi:hypothetical protein
VSNRPLILTNERVCYAKFRLEMNICESDRDGMRKRLLTCYDRVPDSYGCLSIAIDRGDGHLVLLCEHEGCFYLVVIIYSPISDPFSLLSEQSIRTYVSGLEQSLVGLISSIKVSSLSLEAAQVIA